MKDIKQLETERDASITRANEYATKMLSDLEAKYLKQKEFFEAQRQTSIKKATTTYETRKAALEERAKNPVKRRTAFDIELDRAKARQKEKLTKPKEIVLEEKIEPVPLTQREEKLKETFSGLNDLFGFRNGEEPAEEEEEEEMDEETFQKELAAARERQRIQMEESAKRRVEKQNQSFKPPPSLTPPPPPPRNFPPIVMTTKPKPPQ